MQSIDLRTHARTTSRFADLPSPDRWVPAEALASELVGIAIEQWRGRMRNEHGSARVFAALARDLERAGLPGVTTCRGFAEEERRHGVLCGAVVEALGGEAQFDEPALDYPVHDDVTPIEGALRSVLSICCLSETVAVALIQAERLEMPEGPLKELLGEILADEVGHARFGWKMIAELAGTLDADTRARLDDYLLVALEHLEAHELANLAEGPGFGPLGAKLGLCNGDEAREIFFATVREIIVPRLESHGFLAT